jgi:hypothetical protein
VVFINQNDARNKPLRASQVVKPLLSLRQRAAYILYSPDQYVSICCTSVSGSGT